MFEKINLSYFAIGGTALVAMRHNGFIPWDDDVDFVIPRTDYDIFVKDAQKYLKGNYFVQTYEAEKKYYHPFCKLRDSTIIVVESFTKKRRLIKGFGLIFSH